MLVGTRSVERSNNVGSRNPAAAKKHRVIVGAGLPKGQVNTTQSPAIAVTRELARRSVSQLPKQQRLRRCREFLDAPPPERLSGGGAGAPSPRHMVVQGVETRLLLADAKNAAVMCPLLGSQAVADDLPSMKPHGDDAIVRIDAFQRGALEPNQMAIFPGSIVPICAASLTARALPSVAALKICARDIPACCSCRISR
jgi:hypothetical protein